jgi:hypothetical protein
MSREANRRAILACINDFDDADDLADFLYHCKITSDDTSRCTAATCGLSVQIGRQIDLSS